MKERNIFTFIFFLLICLLGFSQSKIGVINDKDGFVNIRVNKSSKSQILGKIHEKEKFTFFEDTTSNWWIIESKNELIGYIHKSRISFVKNGYLQGGEILDKIIEISFDEYILNGVSVNIYQLKPKDNSYDFSCRGLIRTIHANKLIDELKYRDIEPVGSSYGITFSKKQNLPDLFIASKFGDYQGEIIIVGENGKIINFEGGQYFITHNEDYLISEWSSDLSGLSVYDLKNKRIIFKQQLDIYLSSWYYDNGIYYTSEWNGEKETEKTFQIDFGGFELKKSTLKINERRKIEMINPDCSCE